MAHYSTGEPVYALATPFSPSALAVIRASGDDSLSLFQPCFTGSLGKAASSSAIHGFIMGKDGHRIDEVMVIKYAKGHGYTSEEAFEIMCHGSLPVIKEISSLLESLGFREALRGEFTYRAFMHGRMDLTEAEAVEEIVRSRTGKASGEGLPAERETTEGSAAYLKISRIAEGFSVCTRSENLYSMFARPPVR